jgi:hypothetical protein
LGREVPEGEAEVKHPYHDYATEDALSLARDLKYGPLPKPTDPMPTIDEAIGIIKGDPRMKACNWITGQVAIEVLRLSRGEKVRGFA